jgi:hypothetical protein
VTKFVEKLNCLSSEEITTNQHINNNNVIDDGFQIVQNNGNFNNVNQNQITTTDFSNVQNNDNYSNFNPIITVNPNNHHFTPITDTTYGNNPAIIYNNPYNLPTNYANPNSLSYFKIRNVAASRMCLTLKRSTSGDDIMKVGMKPCQQSNSAKQSWMLNPETAYIHSVVDESKCLAPNIEGDDENINRNYKEKKRTRLIVKTCPYFTENIFQWHFSPDGLMKNRKKDVSGHPLIVQASRGLKQKGNQEELLIIPTLSRYPYNLNEYYRWTLVPV